MRPQRQGKHPHRKLLYPVQLDERPIEPSLPTTANEHVSRISTTLLSSSPIEGRP